MSVIEVREVNGKKCLRARYEVTLPAGVDVDVATGNPVVMQQVHGTATCQSCLQHVAIPRFGTKCPECGGDILCK